MERVSKVLQLAVIIKRSRPLFLESQVSEKGDFLGGSLAVEGSGLKKFFESWLFVQRFFLLPFKKFKFLKVSWSHSVV